MISWGFSLIVVSFFGHQAHAQDGPHPASKGITAATAAMSTPPEGTIGKPSNTGSLVQITSSRVYPASSTSTATSSSSSSVIPDFEFFQSNWSMPLGDFPFRTSRNVFYSIPQFPQQNGSSFNPVLFVCQTSAQSGDNMTSQNTWSVAQITENCGGSTSLTCTIQENVTQSITLDFIPGTPEASFNGDNFFVCIGNAVIYINDLICDAYSPFFTIGSQNTPRDVPLGQEDMLTLTTVSGMPTTTLPLPLYTPTVTLSAEQTVATRPPSITSSSITTISRAASATTSTTPSSSTLSASKHPGLSTGAKVGIALGALIFGAALLLLALFLLRRKHRQRSPPPEQVMLTRDMHTDSFGRNALITEKETATQHTNNISSASPIDETLPIQRHSALSPYDSIPTAPYNGTASSIPRRKPTAASAVSRLTSASSPRSVSRPTSNPSEEFEVYHDTPMAMYGDARHSPRVYTAVEGGLNAPFLGEEGMSAEEVARLEEEERRIDAAIAEAEQRR